MNKTNHAILAAAVEVFSAKGVVSATMTDVAKQAGVSRQTVYAAFDSKDALVEAAARLMGQQTMLQIREACQKETELDAKLEHYFQIAVINLYDAVQAMPDAQEFIDSSIPGVERAYAETQAGLQDEVGLILAASSVDLPVNLAKMVVAGSSAIKHQAGSREELVTLLETFKSCVLALVETSPKLG